MAHPRWRDIQPGVHHGWNIYDADVRRVVAEVWRRGHNLVARGLERAVDAYFWRRSGLDCHPSPTGATLITGTTSVPQTCSRQSDCNSLRTTASGHPGGVLVGLADGSTRYVPHTVDGTTWWRLVVRDDGEVVGEY